MISKPLNPLPPETVLGPSAKPSVWQIARGVLGVMGPSLLLLAIVVGAPIAALSGRLFQPSRSLAAAAMQAVGLFGLVFPWLYMLFLRPLHRRWGTTAEERAKRLPSDDAVPHPERRLTRAITVYAPVQVVWPWLAQLGQDRGGFYSYDWLENLAGCNIHSADRIHPEWQQRVVGDKVMLAPSLGMEVNVFEPNRTMVLQQWWGFNLEAVDAQTTRFYARSYDMAYPVQLLYILFIEIPHLIMEHRMMYGIKRRAEQQFKAEKEAQSKG